MQLISRIELWTTPAMCAISANEFIMKPWGLLKAAVERKELSSQSLLLSSSSEVSWTVLIFYTVCWSNLRKSSCFKREHLPIEICERTKLISCWEMSVGKKVRGFFRWTCSSRTVHCTEAKLPSLNLERRTDCMQFHITVQQTWTASSAGDFFFFIIFTMFVCFFAISSSFCS